MMKTWSFLMHRREKTMNEIILKQIEILTEKQEDYSLTVDEIIRLSTQIANLSKMLVTEQTQE